jgi:very-short-patch-repair endonuclease
VLHQVRRLDPRDVTIKDGIPVTTVARTLLDLAEVLHPRQLERALEEAERLRRFDLRSIEDVARRSRGRRGLRPLVAVLGATLDTPPATRSDLERMFLDLCRDGGLPQPQVNVLVEGYEVDAHWPGANLIVELDSWGFHRTRRAFERDRARDMKLKLAGYTVLRLTWRQLTEDRDNVATTLRALLGSSRTHPAHGPDAPARAWP